MRAYKNYLLLVGLSVSCASYAADDYYSEVRLEVAVRAIERKSVDPVMRSHIEGVAAALSYSYDCSKVNPGFLRSFVKVSDALVDYSKSDWGQRSGPHP
jgi:hypothetical protein